MQQVSLIAATTIAVALLLAGMHARKENQNRLPRSRKCRRRCANSVTCQPRQARSRRIHQADAAVKFFLKDADLAWDAAASSRSVHSAQRAARGGDRSRRAGCSQPVCGRRLRKLLPPAGADLRRRREGADGRAKQPASIGWSGTGSRSLRSNASAASTQWPFHPTGRWWPIRSRIGFRCVTALALRTFNKQAILLQSELPKSEKRPKARLIRFLPSNRGLLIGDTTARLIF